MEIRKAIKELKERIGLIDKDYKDDVPEYRKALKTAVEALEKQIPKKPTFEINFGDYTSRFICVCGKRIIVKHDSGVMDNHDAPNYCPNCGQALEWGE